MKACPGLRSGSLSFAIRDIPSSIRPLIRHLYVENASQIRPNCGVRVREVSSVIGRAGQLHGGAGLE